MPSAALVAQHELFLKEKTEGFAANLMRGQPSDEQLDISNIKLTLPCPKRFDGYDLRNYPDEAPGLESARFGLPTVKNFFAAELGCKPSELLVWGHSILGLMGTVVDAYQARGGKWADVAEPKVIIPVPGYDRHFDVLQKRGFEFIPVPVQQNGSGFVDWDNVARIFNNDRSVVAFIQSGIYQNPTGYTETAQDVQKMIKAVTGAAHPHARILGDIAYRWHHIAKQGDTYVDAFDHLPQEQRDRVLHFFSTSKVTGASDGVALMRASDDNLALVRARMDAIGDRKTAQVREYLALKEMGGIAPVMEKHAELLRPRLAAFVDTMEGELKSDSGLARWTTPKGGYFSSLWVPEGTAKRIVAVVSELGAKLTGAGAGYPGNENPADNHIRIAFSRESVSGIKRVAERIAHAIRWVTDRE